MAICAVSWSRISPISTTSGSQRRIERRAAAKFRPALLFTCTWLMPGIRYSTGSSTVMTFFSGVLTMFNVAYRVVDLPDPVGPVTRIIP
jgi:hypothetical protein